MANRYSLGGDRKRANPIASFLRLILDLIIIVIGIYIAFQVDKWGDAEKEQELKVKHLQELRAETQVNLDEIIADQTDRKIQVELFEKLILAASQPVSDDTLRMAIDGLLNYRFYSGTTAVFDNIVASGNLRLITTDSIRSKLFELKQFESKASIVESAEAKLISEQIEPYFIRRQVLYLLEVELSDNAPQTTMSVEQSARIIRTLLQDRTFIDLVYLRLGKIRQTIYFENPLVWRLRDLINEIDEELRKITNEP